LLDPESIKDTISRGVGSGIIGYVGKTKDGSYKPFFWGKSLPAAEIEISEDMYIITAEEAKKHIEPPKLTSIVISPEDAGIEPGKKQAYVVKGLDQHSREIAIGDVLWKATGGTMDKNGVFTAGKDEGNFVITAAIGGITESVNLTIAKEGATPPKPSKLPGEGINKLFWNGEVPPQKWMNFYTKVLSKFAVGKGLKITINVEVSPEGGVSTQKIEETKVALRELGLNDDVKPE